MTYLKGNFDIRYGNKKIELCILYPECDVGDKEKTTSILRTEECLSSPVDDQDNHENRLLLLDSHHKVCLQYTID